MKFYMLYAIALIALANPLQAIIIQLHDDLGEWYLDCESNLMIKDLGDQYEIINHHAKDPSQIHYFAPKTDPEAAKLFNDLVKRYKEQREREK